MRDALPTSTGKPQPGEELSAKQPAAGPNEKGESPEPSTEGEGKPDEGEQVAADSEAATASKKKGEPTQNSKVKEGALDDAPMPQEPKETATDAAQREADVAAQKFREEAWFAKLPPELRKAIRAKPQRRAPRGYEERLRRYFESID
jgi:hypothetical protein